MADEAQSDRVVALEATVNELKEQLAELRALKQTSLRTMREHSSCPACGCRKILFADRVLDRDSGVAQDMSIAKTVWLSKAIGKFQMCVCVACGYCEWYVPDLAEHVDELCKKEDHFRVVDATDTERADGPYR